MMTLSCYKNRRRRVAVFVTPSFALLLLLVGVTKTSLAFETAAMPLKARWPSTTITATAKNTAVQQSRRIPRSAINRSPCRNALLQQTQQQSRLTAVLKNEETDEVSVAMINANDDNDEATTKANELSSLLQDLSQLQLVQTLGYRTCLLLCTACYGLELLLPTLQQAGLSLHILDNGNNGGGDSLTTVSYYATLGATVLAAVSAPKASSSSRSSSASSKTATTTTTTTSKKGNGQGQTQKQRMLPLLVDGKKSLREL